MAIFIDVSHEKRLEKSVAPKINGANTFYNHLHENLCKFAVFILFEDLRANMKSFSFTVYVCLLVPLAS